MRGDQVKFHIRKELSGTGSIQDGQVLFVV